MKDINVQVSGVEKLLGNINPQKAEGTDEVHGRVLKECRNRKSLILGKIPRDWKHGNVYPVYKKDDKHDPRIRVHFSDMHLF